MMIFQITKQIASFMHSADFERSIEQERKNITQRKGAKALLPAFREVISDLCGALFEKVYVQFLANL